jgi:hypothetical protein
VVAVEVLELLAVLVAVQHPAQVAMDQHRQ